MYGKQGNKYKYLKKYPPSFMSIKQWIVYYINGDGVVRWPTIIVLDWLHPKWKLSVELWWIIYSKDPCLVLVRVPDLFEVQSQVLCKFMLRKAALTFVGRLGINCHDQVIVEFWGLYLQLEDKTCCIATHQGRIIFVPAETGISYVQR